MLEPEWQIEYCKLDCVVVYYVDLKVDNTSYRTALNWLDDSEQKRLPEFRTIELRRQFALCRATLRSRLCHFLNCENQNLAFGFGQFGKPFATVAGVAVPLEISITHSGSCGLIAISENARVGIDAEIRTLDYDWDGISRRVFRPNERHALGALSEIDRIDRFFDFWTIKEALIKALGTGFSLDPIQFQIPQAMLDGAKSATFQFPNDSDRFWQLQNIGSDVFAACLAYELT